jgi:hypothetical protein
MITEDEMIEKLKSLKAEGQSVLATARDSGFAGTYISSGTFNGWRNKILAFINRFSFVPSEIIMSIHNQGHTYPSDVNAVCKQLDTLIQLLEEDYIDFDNTSTSKKDSDAILENLFNRFHKVARQLRTRHDSRATLNISDEYDVQDLLHALLLISFDDVRPEEWTPSYAGSASRMDFLLKNEKTVIEVKKTRKSMTQKSLGEELIIDIEKYQTHPDCEKLYCFVYDPEGLLGNPTGIKNDL